MRVLATSDLHGHLPEIPECDILIIGGDICPLTDHRPEIQSVYLERIFAPWLEQVPATHIIGIAGNHDFVFEDRRAVDILELPWTYLCDEAVEVEGLKFYGLPWVPNLPSWAFHLNKEGLALRYDGVPKDTDIVISHGPPYGHGDLTGALHGNERVGCRAANNMLSRVRPHALICGHIHEGFGYYSHRPQHGDLIGIYNVAYVDEYYEPREQIVEILLDGYIKSDAREEQTDSEREVHRTDTCAR